MAKFSLRAVNGTLRSRFIKGYNIDVVRQFCYEHRGELVNPRIYSQWAMKKNAAKLVGVQILHIFAQLKLEEKTNPTWLAPRMFFVPEDFEPPKKKEKSARAGSWSFAAKERHRKMEEKKLVHDG